MGQLWLWLAVALAGKFDPPSAERVRALEALVGKEPLPPWLQWGSDPQGLTLEAALAALPRPDPEAERSLYEEDMPRDWGSYRFVGVDRFVVDYGAVLAALQAQREEALRALSQDESTSAMLVRVLLRDPTTARTVLQWVESDVWYGGPDGMCTLSYTEWGRELLLLLTGLPFRQAYPLPPSQLDKLWALANESFDPRLKEESYYAEGYFLRCSAHAVARQLLAELGELHREEDAPSPSFERGQAVVARVQRVRESDYRGPYGRRQSTAFEIVVERSIHGGYKPGDTLFAEAPDGSWTGEPRPDLGETWIFSLSRWPAPFSLWRTDWLVGVAPLSEEAAIRASLAGQAQ